LDAETGVKSGTKRQDAFVVVWERIVDEDNLEQVTKTFTEKDLYRLRKRIGTLNMFNPFAPDGAYCLDFTVPEERTIASIMIQLSLKEDLTSISDERFTEYVIKKGEEEKGPQEITWGDPEAVNEEGQPDPKLSKEYHYPKAWAHLDEDGLPDQLPEPSSFGGPIWEFRFKTSLKQNLLERRRIAEQILGWEFGETEEKNDKGEKGDVPESALLK